MSNIEAQLRAQVADLTRDRDNWKHEAEMYSRAWIRELGGWLLPKSHLIDALVLTTRMRCVKPLLGHCSTTHFLGKPTQDGKALSQEAHPLGASCYQWKVEEPADLTEELTKLKFATVRFESTKEGEGYVLSIGNIGVRWQPSIDGNTGIEKLADAINEQITTIIRRGHLEAIKEEEGG